MILPPQSTQEAAASPKRTRNTHSSRLGGGVGKKDGFTTRLMKAQQQHAAEQKHCTTSRTPQSPTKLKILDRRKTTPVTDAGLIEKALAASESFTCATANSSSSSTSDDSKNRPCGNKHNNNINNDDTNNYTLNFSHWDFGTDDFDFFPPSKHQLREQQSHNDIQDVEETLEPFFVIKKGQYVPEEEGHNRGRNSQEDERLRRHRSVSRGASRKSRGSSGSHRSKSRTRSSEKTSSSKKNKGKPLSSRRLTVDRDHDRDSTSNGSEKRRSRSTSRVRSSTPTQKNADDGAKVSHSRSDSAGKEPRRGSRSKSRSRSSGNRATSKRRIEVDTGRFVAESPVVTKSPGRGTSNRRLINKKPSPPPVTSTPSTSRQKSLVQLWSGGDVDVDDDDDGNAAVPAPKIDTAAVSPSPELKRGNSIAAEDTSSTSPRTARSRRRADLMVKSEHSSASRSIRSPEERQRRRKSLAAVSATMTKSDPPATNTTPTNAIIRGPSRVMSLPGRVPQSPYSRRSSRRLMSSSSHTTTASSSDDVHVDPLPSPRPNSSSRKLNKLRSLDHHDEKRDKKDRSSRRMSSVAGVSAVTGGDIVTIPPKTSTLSSSHTHQGTLPQPPRPRSDRMAGLLAKLRDPSSRNLSHLATTSIESVNVNANADIPLTSASGHGKFPKIGLMSRFTNGDRALRID